MTEENTQNTRRRRSEPVWIGTGIIILLVLGAVTSGSGVAGAIGRTIGYNVVTVAFTIGAFFLSDFIPNKTAARIVYVALFMGIVYLYYGPR